MARIYFRSGSDDKFKKYFFIFLSIGQPARRFARLLPRLSLQCKNAIASFPGSPLLRGDATASTLIARSPSPKFWPPHECSPMGRPFYTKTIFFAGSERSQTRGPMRPSTKSCIFDIMWGRSSRRPVAGTINRYMGWRWFPEKIIPPASDTE